MATISARRNDSAVTRRGRLPGRPSTIFNNTDIAEYKESHPASQLLIDRYGMPEARANLVARLAWGESSI